MKKYAVTFETEGQLEPIEVKCNRADFLDNGDVRFIRDDPNPIRPIIYLAIASGKWFSIELLEDDGEP